MLAAVWNKNRDVLLQRMDTIDEFCRRLPESASDQALREQACSDAHKLAGSLGMFGLSEGTGVAREIEYFLRDNSPSELLAANIPLLTSRLRVLIEFFHISVDALPPERRRRLLIVENNEEVAQAIFANAEKRGIDPRIVTDFPSARQALHEAEFDIVVFNLASVEMTGHAISNEYAGQVRDFLMSRSPMQVLALTSVDTFEDRVTAAQIGAHGFLPNNVPVSEIVDTCEHLLDLQTAHFKVLTVDDDAEVLNAIKAMLEKHSIRVTSISDPRLFWNALEENAPDLVILDLEMPNFSGLEVCRAVRNDPQWNRMPILFLSVNSDAQTVTSIFSAGADDFVPKPIIELELTTRVRNRLDRDRLYRNLSDYDQLTSVRNRRSSSVVIANYLRLAERHGLPVSVAVVDLDKFKRVNDTYGHQAGDDVLQFLGGLLRQSFRSEDVVARWGGEEFVIAMFAMRRAAAIERIAEVLERLEDHEFEPSPGTRFRVSFSAGVAEFPAEGKDLHSLYRLSDEALYKAKAAGGRRVFSSLTGTEDARIDVAIVCADAAISAPLRHLLEMRGYSVDMYYDVADGIRELAAIDHSVAPRTIVIDGLPPEGAAGVLQSLRRGPDASRPEVFLLVSPEAAATPLPDGNTTERIVRPFKPSALVQLIRRALNQ